MRFIAVFAFFLTIHAQAQHIIEHVGVYQGKELFIQNPYNPLTKDFCIDAVYVNGKKEILNYRLSALILDFKSQDLFTPVSIKVVGKDSTCMPLIINPDAIMFHTEYKFNSVQITDSVLVWETEGERQRGSYTVEKLFTGIWVEKKTVEASGTFEKAEYRYYPEFEEGGNKYRIKYDFGNGRYLYSEEVEYNYYPEPVEFEPKEATTTLTFSRSASYSIFDKNGKEVMSGLGSSVDVSKLYPGEYVIYFDGVFPGVFDKVWY